ncbi:hypothetical protein BDW60DRAFT_208595 [Aspergillus nidulans var. acristatus]
MSSAASSDTPARYEVEVLDEWKGVVDPRKRRTLQNRLNQRAHRRRKKASQARTETAQNAAIRPKEASAAGSTVDSASQGAVVKHTPQGQDQCQTHQQIQTFFPDLDRVSILGPQAEKSKYILRRLESLFYAEYAANSPRTDLLLGLTRVNFLRALHTNIEVLGYSAAELHDEALSQFGTAGPVKPSLRPTDNALFPASLQPTPIQLTVPHHPWLDLLPFPQMRDNLILAEVGVGEGRGYDDVQLCRDMCGYGTLSLPADRRPGNGETGIIIWKDPWDPDGWEVTETFLRRWGWVVAGCTELFRATNRWRAVRGERPLFRLDG